MAITRDTKFHKIVKELINKTYKIQLQLVQVYYINSNLSGQSYRS